MDFAVYLSFATFNYIGGEGFAVNFDDRRDDELFCFCLF